MMKNGFMNRPFGLVAVHNDLLESAAGLFRATLETEMPVEGEWMFRVNIFNLHLSWQACPVLTA